MNHLVVNKATDRYDNFFDVQNVLPMHQSHIVYKGLQLAEIVTYY